MGKSDLMPSGEVCRELGVCSKTLGRWMEAGLIEAPVRTAGGHTRFYRATIEMMKTTPRRDWPKPAIIEPSPVRESPLVERSIVERQSAERVSLNKPAPTRKRRAEVLTCAAGAEDSMSLEGILLEFGISPYVVRLWDKRGLLSPVHESSRGKRYDRHDVLKVRKREGLPRDNLAPREPPVKREPELVVNSDSAAPSAMPPAPSEGRRRVEKVRGLGPLRLPAKIVAAKTAADDGAISIEQFHAMLDDALRSFIGVDRQELSGELHRRAERNVAGFLGVSVRRLREICTLYEVNAADQPDGARSAIAKNELPFEGKLGQGVEVSDYVD